MEVVPTVKYEEREDSPFAGRILVTFSNTENSDSAEVNRNYTGISPSLFLSNTDHTSVGILLTFIGIIGLVENGIVLVVYCKTKQLQTSTNIFIVSMTISHIIVAIIAIPYVTISSLSHSFILGKTTCEWYAFVIFSLGLVVIFHLCAVSVDRYFVITRPQTTITKNVCLHTIAICWVAAILWALPPLLGWNSYIQEKAHYSCCINWYSRNPKDWSYTVTIFVCCLTLPLAIIVYSYSCIYYTVLVQKNNIFRWDVNKKGWKKAMKKDKSEKRMAKMIFAMIIAFLVSWMPYAVVSMWAAFGDKENIPPTSTVVPAILAKCSVMWNPVIYVAMNRQFRKAFVKMIERKSPSPSNGNQQGTTSL